jgi:hypothetical protein
MPSPPVELTFEIEPQARFDIIDVRRWTGPCRDALEAYPRALYCSYHTTAGYLPQGLALRLTQAELGIAPYMQLFQTLFPAGAGYRHDELELRAELSRDQRRVEPRNADAHLAFIASDLRNCARYVNRPDMPVYFVDLDGVNGQMPRRRLTSVLAFDAEEVVASVRIDIPVSAHRLDSVNLKDARLGLYERINALIRRHGVSKGRIRLSLAPGEHQAALTINEYETLLMRHDLIDVLRNPVRFVAERGRSMLSDPWSIPNKTIGYAQYDMVRLFNQTLDLFHMNATRFEDLVARVARVPARRFLRMKRSVSLLVSDRCSPGYGQIADGTYQSPILVQWSTANGRCRAVDVTLTRLI